MEAAGKQHIVYSSSNPAFSIWNVADIHYGNIGCNKGKLMEDLHRIAEDPYSFWYGGGDFCDYISHRDAKRFSAGTIDPDIKVKDLGRLGNAQIEFIKRCFMPIRHKCLGLLLGNHEAKYMSNNEQEDLHEKLCKDLDVPNLGYCCFSDINFVREKSAKTPTLVRETRAKSTDHSVRFFLHHGFGGSITPGGKLNSLIKAMNYFDADVYFMGHVHERINYRMTKLCASPECNTIQQREKVGVITGSYLMTYSQGSCSYGEVKAYQPVTLGAGRVIVEPNTRTIRGEV